MISTHDTIEEIEFQTSPDGEKGGTLKMTEVVKIMKYISLEIEQKEED